MLTRDTLWDALEFDLDSAHEWSAEEPPSRSEFIDTVAHAIAALNDSTFKRDADTCAQVLSKWRDVGAVRVTVAARHTIRGPGTAFRVRVWISRRKHTFPLLARVFARLARVDSRAISGCCAPMDSPGASVTVVLDTRAYGNRQVNALTMPREEAEAVWFPAITAAAMGAL